MCLLMMYVPIKSVAVNFRLVHQLVVKLNFALEVLLSAQRRIFNDETNSLRVPKLNRVERTLDNGKADAVSVRIMLVFVEEKSVGCVA